jgi:FkbM family methyltransferase
MQQLKTWEAADLERRLTEGAGRPCVFMPFLGEFGHEVMTHTRIVHYHQASEKIVCCRPGHQVLYPSATGFCTDWTDPLPDVLRVGTLRSMPFVWQQLPNRFPGYQAIHPRGMTLAQELHVIRPGERLPFRPKRRGLKADLVFGVRRRDFAAYRNWPHWPAVAAAARAHGWTFAVMGARETSFGLEGQVCHTGDLDTDAAIELLQGCRLYVGTDSGGSHLAAAVGAPMLVFRERGTADRDLTWRMECINPGRVDVPIGGWEDPQVIIDRINAHLLGQARFEFPDPETFPAQHGEDWWMSKHFDRLGLPPKGVFVEVGAADGRTWSNTWWLARSCGWSGLLVEADPRHASALTRNRPESNIAHVCAGDGDGWARFLLADEPTLSGGPTAKAGAVSVPQLRLSTLLHDRGIPRVDVLSIDTEGTELAVWGGLDLQRWRPRLVFLEWRTPGLPDRRPEICARLEADGYRLDATLGGNLAFIDAAA